MHALVGAAAILLMVTAALDLAHGRTDFGDEVPHVLAVCGWLLLGRVAAATPAPASDPRFSFGPVVRAVTHRRPPAGVGVVSRRPHGRPAGAESEPERRAG
jgi:hypothetical protein